MEQADPCSRSSYMSFQPDKNLPGMVDLQVQQLGFSPIYLNVLLQTAMACFHKTKSLFVLPAGHLRGHTGSHATIAVWIKQPICRACTLKEKGSSFSLLEPIPAVLLVSLGLFGIEHLYPRFARLPPGPLFTSSTR